MFHSWPDALGLDAEAARDCAHRVKELSAADGIDVGFWLPEAALSAFA
jgi:hypothetical protein